MLTLTKKFFIFSDLLLFIIAICAWVSYGLIRTYKEEITDIREELVIWGSISLLAFSLMTVGIFIEENVPTTNILILLALFTSIGVIISCSYIITKTDRKVRTMDTVKKSVYSCVLISLIMSSILIISSLYLMFYTRKQRKTSESLNQSDMLSNRSIQSDQISDIVKQEMSQYLSNQMQQNPSYVIPTNKVDINDAIQKLSFKTQSSDLSQLSS